MFYALPSQGKPQPRRLGVDSKKAPKHRAAYAPDWPYFSAMLQALAVPLPAPRTRFGPQAIRGSRSGIEPW